MQLNKNDLIQSADEYFKVYVVIMSCVYVKCMKNKEILNQEQVYQWDEVRKKYKIEIIK